MSVFPFLSLPPEIRLLVYDIYFIEHKRVHDEKQPYNDHIRLLHLCRDIYYEAASLFRSYVSFRHERQISNFLRNADSHDMSTVLWADVANDGRALVRRKGDGSDMETPISRLHLVLRRMEALVCLRVFDCRQGVPVHGLTGSGKSIRLRFEGAMLPDTTPRNKKLSSYRLHLDSTTRSSLFDMISPYRLESLRISGDCTMPTRLAFPALRYLTVHSVTNKDFDRRSLEDSVMGCQLESFVYSMGDRLGFEIRDFHLKSLVTGIGAHLRKLVLLGCSRLSSDALTACLGELLELEYCALHIVTVSEFRRNFVEALNSKVCVFKLEITNAWHATPLIDEERRICDSIEVSLLHREPPPDQVCVSMRKKIWSEKDRPERWRALAAAGGIRLMIGKWKDDEEV